MPATGHLEYLAFRALGPSESLDCASTPTREYQVVDFHMVHPLVGSLDALDVQATALEDCVDPYCSTRRTGLGQDGLYDEDC